ncbi:unnamed protein product, partial [Rotaria sp. Silwood1]
MGNKQPKQTVSSELTEKRSFFFAINSSHHTISIVLYVELTLLKINTEYTEKEIREWHEGFIHDCPTGRLDKKKFVEIYRQFYPNGKADTYCKYTFNRFDTNNDGTIDFQEFLLAIAATSQGSLDDRLTAVFNMYDFSHNGLIEQ